MKKHECKFTDKDGTVGYIEQVKDRFELVLSDVAGEGTTIFVKYCPFCGELSPEYKQTCFKCNKNSEAECQFSNYYYDGKDITLCGICRKGLDEAVENDRNKSIREFLNGVTPLIDPKELWRYMCKRDNPECKVKE
jgi:hypothetical protein